MEEIGRYLDDKRGQNGAQQWVLSKVCRVGTHWMQNLIPHPTSSLDQNLSKNMRRYVENTNKKVVFSMIPTPKFIFKKCLRSIRYFNFKSISLANT